MSETAALPAEIAGGGAGNQKMDLGIACEFHCLGCDSPSAALLFFSEIILCARLLFFYRKDTISLHAHITPRTLETGEDKVGVALQIGGSRSEAQLAIVVA
jgi:hypothetical protein